MTRSEIISKFREENPEITTNVISPAILNTWCLVGNIEICTKARLIVGSTTLTTSLSGSTGVKQYNLTSLITNFYDIDEWPGGGVTYYTSSTEYRRLTRRTVAELDQIKPGWRGITDNGTPMNYYRRGQYLYLDRPPEGSKSLEVYTVLLPDDFDDDAETPFNQLTYLKPFHYSVVLYLTMRAKAKVSKSEEAKNAMAEYESYVQWMKEEVGGGKYSVIKFRPRRR